MNEILQQTEVLLTTIPSIAEMLVGIMLVIIWFTMLGVVSIIFLAAGVSVLAMFIEAFTGIDIADEMKKMFRNKITS